MTSPLNVALVSAFPPGRLSLNEYGLHLAKGLAERSDVASVTVIADTIPEGIQELDLGPKIKVCRVWQFNSLTAGPKILRALSKMKPDGVLWNLQTATFGDKEVSAALGLLAPMGTRVFGIPSGVIAHNILAGIDLNETQLKGQIVRQAVVKAGGAIVTRAMTLANYMTVTLQGYHDLLTKSYPRADIQMVPHGTFDVSTSDFKPLADRSRQIVTMGKFGTYKRLETLLAAFETLREEKAFQDLKLVIGGTDHPATPGYLDSLAAKHSDDPNIVFHGYVAEDDIGEFFGNALLSVFDYSSTTGSSGVLHQTASYGALPVFPRIGDFVDLCRDEGLNGAHYEPLDANDMAQAMAAALNDIPASQAITDSNRNAADGMPFSEVIGFHVNRMHDLVQRSVANRLADA